MKAGWRLADPVSAVVARLARPGSVADTARAVDAATLALDPEERLAWERDGFFVRRRAFGPEEVAALAKAAERVVARAAAAAAASAERYAIDGNEYVEVSVEQRPSTVQLEHRPGSLTLRVIEPFHHLDPWFDRLVDDPRIVEPMRGLVGSERVALFTDKLNLKRPREGSGFGWHQDSPYWAHFCAHLDQLPNVMLALDDAGPDNGCLRVIRGSHRRGMLPGRTGEGVLGPLFTHPRHVDASAEVVAAMPAGSLIFFSPHTVHGSQPNRSEAPRRALVLTYQPGGLSMFKVDRVRDAGAPARP